MPRDLSLSDAQQYFLQTILNKSVIDQFNFKTLFCNVLNKFQIEYSESSLKPFYVNFLREINEVIKHFNMEIKTGICEITGLSYYCIYRQCDTNAIGKLSLLYTPNELRIFRKILELIVESDQGYVEYNQMINDISDYYDEIANEAKNENQSTKIPNNKEIRIAIEKFVQDYWLAELINEPNKFTLHGRALIELSQYIKQVLDNEIINHCYLCKSIVLIYFGCENCSSKMHRHCAKRLLKESQDCPSCRYKFNSEQIKDLFESLNAAKNQYATQTQTNSP